MFEIGSAQHLFMMEKSGMDDMVSTKTAALNAIIYVLRHEVLDDIDMANLFYEHGIDIDQLTTEEKRYLETETGKLIF